MKIFKMNDVEWYAGETSADCLKLMKKNDMYDKQEIKEFVAEGYPRELDEEQMNHYKINLH